MKLGIYMGEAVVLVLAFISCEGGFLDNGLRLVLLLLGSVRLVLILNVHVRDTVALTA